METNSFQIITYIAMFVKLITRTVIDEDSMFSYLLYGVIIIFGFIGLFIYFRKNKVKPKDILQATTIANIGIIGFTIYLLIKTIIDN